MLRQLATSLRTSASLSCTSSRSICRINPRITGGVHETNRDRITRCRGFSDSSSGGGKKAGGRGGDYDDGFGLNSEIEDTPAFNRLGSPSKFAADMSSDGDDDVRITKEFIETWNDEKYYALAEKILSRREERAKLARDNAPSQDKFSVIRSVNWRRGVNRTAENDMEDDQANVDYLKRIPEANRDQVIKDEGLGEEPITGVIDPIAHDWHMNSRNPFDEVPTPADRNRHKKKPPNRKNAVPLDREDLHHLNLDLLHKYLTPGNQIMKRRQTQLGAKDQRKVAKLIKRARKMGLIPHVGQWKVWDKGAMPQEILRVLEKRNAAGQE